MPHVQVYQLLMLFDMCDVACCMFCLLGCSCTGRVRVRVCSMFEVQTYDSLHGYKIVFQREEAAVLLPLLNWMLEGGHHPGRRELLKTTDELKNYNANFVMEI